MLNIVSLKDFDDIRSSFAIYKKLECNIDRSEERAFKQSVHKHFIISIYTAWETIIKEAVFSTYSEYKGIIINQRFLRQYFRSVYEKKYVKDEFIENVKLDSITITEKSLCHSNNLNYKELTSILKRICFNVNELPKHFSDLDEFDVVISDFKAKEFAPIMSKNLYPKSIFEYFQAYLNTLIISRNAVAHKYEVVEPFELDQLEILLDFVELSTKIILKFLGSQIIKAGISKKKYASIYLIPIKIFKGGRNPIVGVRNISQITLKKNMIFYLYDNERDIYRHVDLIETQVCGNSVDNIYPYSEFSMKLKTKKGIQDRQVNPFRICTLNHTIEPYNHSIFI